MEDNLFQLPLEKQLLYQNMLNNFDKMSNEQKKEVFGNVLKLQLLQEHTLIAMSIPEHIKKKK